MEVSMNRKVIGKTASVLTLIIAAVCTTLSCSKKTNTTSIELFSTKGENVATLQKLADKFTAEKNGSIKITIISPQDASTVLRSRLTKNDIPDMMAIGGDSTYTELASAGVLENLSNEPFIADIQENYLQMLYDVNKDTSKTAYAVPYAANGSGVLYNKTLFQKAGISIPKTWDDFTADFDKLQKAGIKPVELTFMDAWTCLPTWNSMAPVLQPKNFTDNRRSGKTTFAATHREILEKYLVILGKASGDYMGTSYNDGNKNFAEGKAAMMINGNWAIPEFTKVNPDIDVDMFAFPATNNPAENTVTSGIDVAFAVSAASPNKKASEEFLAFLVKPENAQFYVDEQFAFPAVKGATQNNKTVNGVKDDIAAGKVSNFPDHYYPSGFDLASILSQFALNYKNGMDNETNITQTLAACDKQYDAVNVQ
jgi:raffinose/stachyose/melibiose transport system substrate-binding protein